MKTFSIPGASDSITLSIAVTRPVDTPKAILQMVHGMAEHKGRYIAMMEYLSERGYICVMNDIKNPDIVPINKELKIPELQKK